MNKLTKLLSVFVIAGALGAGVTGVAACKKGGSGSGGGSSHDSHNYTYTDNNNGTHDGTCDGCDIVIDDEAHTYGDDNKCTKCDHVTTPTELNADDYSAAPVVVQTYEDVTGSPAAVADPIVPTYSGPAAALENGDVDAVFEFDAATLSTTKYADGWTNGTFSLAKGTEVRGRIKTGLYEGTECVNAAYQSVNSVKLGSGTDALEVNVPAAGTLVFYVQNGSSGQTGTQTVVLTKPDDSTENINYLADGNGSTIQRITLQLDAAGKYKISRTSGTSDIYYAKFTTTLQESAVESIQIANTGKTDFLVGQQLDCTSVAVVRKHATGVTIPVPSSNIEIDASAYNPAVAGTYEIGVKYTLEGNLDSEQKVFETSYEVNVYDYGDLSVHIEYVKQGSQSAAGNGTYVNNAFRQFYTVGETFSTDGIALSVVGKLGEKTKNFKLDASVANITGADLTTPGVQTVKIAYTINGITKAKGVLITVKDKPGNIATESEVIVAVNKEFAQTNVGTKNAYGAYRFNTIQQALEFLSATELDENTPKTMYLAEGTYWEKVEVNVPNLTIIGAGAEKTKIEYDALYGVEDAGGFVHITDSTATFNVRDKAVGFTIKGVTISNYYNTAASYEGAPSNDCRALAMLIMADKVVVEDCTLLGYQDTLELFTGRQYFKNCLILGVTDYIFGTNNTTYFYKCELRNINHKNASQPGYVTAFKGNNKGSDTDKITYGAIFDDCDFTAEDGVPADQCAMGRAWGVDAAVMVMNSRIGGHISKHADGEKDENGKAISGRYISMGNGDPKGCQFTEYNNTGDGAITESLNTVTVLTAEQAKNYNDFAVIFGKTNNKVSYSSEWDGSYGSRVTEKSFNFDDITGGSFNYEDFTDMYTGGLSVKGSGNVEAHKSQAKFDVGTVIKVLVKGKVTVTWYGGDYGTEANGRIVYKDGYATINIIGSESDQIYITKITVDLETVPADTVERTVTVKEGENVLGTLTVNDGDKVTLKQIKAFITGEAYEGKEIGTVYGADGTTEFDFDAAISADTTIVVTVQDKQVITQQTITTATKYTYDKSADAIEDTEYFKFTNCDKNGDWFKYGHKAGSSIEFTVAPGAVITWTCSPYDGGSVSINGVDQNTGANSVVMYVCAEGGKITITASGQCFFKELSVLFSTVHTVSFDLDYEGAPEMDDVTVLNEGKVTEPSKPKRDGYTFIHWYTGDDDSVAYDFDTAVTEAITLKAKWVEGNAEPKVYGADETVSFAVAAGATPEIDGVTVTGDCTGHQGTMVKANVGTIIEVSIEEDCEIEIEWYNATQLQYGSDANLKDGKITYADGKAIIEIVASDGTLGGTDGNIYIRSMKVVKYFGAGEISLAVAAGATPEIAGVKVTGDCTGHQDTMVKANVGTKIEFNIKEGCTVEIEWYDAGNPSLGGNGNLKDGEVKIENGKATIEIVEATDGTGGANGNIYIKGIKIVKHFGAGETISLAVAAGATPAIAGVTITGDCTGHQGTMVKANVGTKIEFNIKEGCTVEVEWYDAGNPSLGGNGNLKDGEVKIENGKATIEIVEATDGTGGANGNIYIKGIKIVAAE